MLINYKEKVYCGGLDCILENEVKLYAKDWNGTCYSCGYKNEKVVNKTYTPIVDINGSKITLIGFDEV